MNPTPWTRAAAKAPTQRFVRWPTCLGIAAVAAGAILLGNGCSAERKYSVLSFFFDGVPNPNGEPEEDRKRREPARDKKVTARKVIETGSRHPRQTCSGCHSTSNSFALIAAATELCQKSCHRPQSLMFQAPHELGCLACHSPHSSPNPKLLRRTDRELCADCHDEASFPWLELHREKSGAECQHCHSLHSGSGPDLLLAPAGG